MVTIAQKKYLNTITPRYFYCPDGITRIFYFSNWHWEALDWITAEKGEDAVEIITFCWRVVSEENPPDFEYQFMAMVNYHIFRLARVHTLNENNLANDEFFDEDWLAEHDERDRTAEEHS